MGLITELRARLRHAIGPLVGALLVFYFAYHLVRGERGLMAWVQVRQGIEASRAVLAEVKAERAVLEHRVHLLRAGSLDPDLLDERARRVLNLGRADETIVFPESSGAGSN